MTGSSPGDLAVFRRAGLPVGVLDQLRFPRSTRLVEEVVAGRRRVRAEGRALADELHPVIGRLPPGSVIRPRAVGLRRALHAGRRPAAAEWTAELAEALPTTVAERVARWLAEVAALAAAEASVGEVLAAEGRERRRALLTFAADPGFRLAVDGTSPVLAEQMRKWVEDQSRVPRDRTMWMIARYLARAAAKTSPLSTFLTSGPVTWVGDGPAVADHGPTDRYGVFELSYRPLREEIAGLVAAQPGARDQVPLALNPTVWQDGGHVLYLEATGGEALRALPARPAVLAVIDALAAAPVGLRRPVLRDHLTRGDPALRAPVAAFLDHLIETGLVVPGLPVDRIEDVFPGSAGWLRGLTTYGDELAGLADELAGLGEALASPVPVEEVAAYRTCRTRALAGVHRLARYAAPDDRRRSMLASVTIHGVRDTVVTAHQVATCAVSAWQPVLADLDVLRAWLAPFSPSLPPRLILTELLSDQVRTGEAMPVLAFYREYQKIINSGGVVAAELSSWLDPSANPRAQDSAVPAVRRLAGVMDAALAALAVDLDSLRSAASEYPAWVPALASISAEVQAAGSDDGGVTAVVNRLHTGFGSFRARLDHLLSGCPGTSTRTGKSSVGTNAGPLYAGFRDRFGLSLNDHYCLLPYEIGDSPYLLPGSGREHRAGQGAERLPITDLSVRLDDESGLLALWSATHRRPVRVVHTGLMAIAQLPPFSRLLTVLSGQTPPAAPLPPLPAETLGRHRQSWPRLVAGRLVLRRAGTALPVTCVPAPRPGEQDGDYLLRLAEWQLAERLPRRCFFTLVPGAAAPTPQTPLDTPWAATKWRKPMYLDFDSWLLVQGFVRAVGRPETLAVIFWEALPDPLAPEPGSAAGVDPSRHVAELVLDVTAVS